MRKHAAANDAVCPVAAPDRQVRLLALADRRAWAKKSLEIGDEANGWRNAQASVLAPTGTIGLMMDCDTTGIEPDLALVKFKKLVGGAFDADRQPDGAGGRCGSLGYTEDEQVEAIVEYISENGHVVRTLPVSRPEHY